MSFTLAFIRIPNRVRQLAAIVFAAAILALATHHAVADVIAGWDVHSSSSYGVSPLAATVSGSNVTVGGLTRGAGVSTAGTAASRAWGGSAWTASSESAAISATQYATWTITANAGYTMSISSINRLDYRRSGSGASSGELQYEIGNGQFIDASAISYSGTSSSGASAGPIDLSGIAALQNVPAGTTVTFRLVNWGGTSSSGTWYIFDVANSTADDLEISGAVTAGNAPAAEVRVETAADGSGIIVPAQTIATGSSVMAYAISRDSSHNFIANVSAAWSLLNVTGGVVNGDLVASGDGKSATFTPHAAGSANIQALSGSLTAIASGAITSATTSTNLSGAAGVSNSGSVLPGGSVQITVVVTPGAVPSSTGITVTGDLSPIGGSSTQVLSGSGNTFTYTASVPSGQGGGARQLNFTIADAQGRTATASATLNVRGQLVIFHTNDTHARITPHKWIIPAHTSGTDIGTQFEMVGGAAYQVSELLALTGSTPDSLVLDGGDISEGNPLGDWNGPGTDIGTYGNGTAMTIWQMESQKLKNVPGRGGRGIDAMVVGNHDIRDITYINNMKNQTDIPIISINICNHGTHTPYFAPYVIVNVGGNKVGIIGYTTESSDSPEPAVNNLIDVVKCDWSSTDSTKIHFSDYVNDLRNNQGCNIIILLTHMGHSGLCTVTSDSPTPILVDNTVAKLPEIAITGHWHTWCETIWQPTTLNYKTIFSEAGSYMHYVGELRTDGSGRYETCAYYPLRNSSITPDSDINTFIDQRKQQYATTNGTSGYGLDQVIGYTADDLLLDNKFKWWSADEYPWAGDNTAGEWICDGIQWKALQLFGSCDFSIESGGGVRSDIPAGPMTYTQIYETYPWADDTIYRVNMTGQQVWNYIQQHDCDVGVSSALHITAFDGNPTAITVNGQPINLSQTYTVAISNYMYLHDTVPFTDPSPLTSVYLARTALVEYSSQFSQASPLHIGPARYTLNTDYSGGYTAVVTMLNDNDSNTSYEDGFIRLLNANAETLGHLGTPQVPTNLVNPDGSINRDNRLSETEHYRSYLGFRTGLLKPGDIIQVWGKGGFFGGDPEFVDSEGVQGDGVEFNVVGHNANLAQPNYVSSINAFFNNQALNHYVKFYAKKAGTSSVTDLAGTTITVEDNTGFSTRTLPGNVGDLLQLTGVATSESYALRFRCDSAVLASSVGVTGYLPDSQIAPLPAMTQDGSPLLLTSTASAPGSQVNVVTLAPVADAQVSSANAATNYGSSNNLFVSSATTGFGNERSWLRFDLSSLPAGTTITAASLKMWCWSTSGPTMQADCCVAGTDAWGESTINWNNQPSVGPILSSTNLSSNTKNSWVTCDVTSLVQSQFSADKLASVVVKADSENSSSAPNYGFDSKEYGSTAPYLEVDLPASTNAATVASVQFFYRYSVDNQNWSAWTQFQTATSAPFAASFAYPNGEGYYEFYSIATDSTGQVEPAPAYRDAATYYAPAATNIAAHGSTLNGSVDPNGSDTNVYFQYGTDATYGQSTSPTDIGGGTSPVSISQGLSGLTSGTTYHYRMVVISNGVTTYYPDQTFATGNEVPALPAWLLWALALSTLAVAIHAASSSRSTSRTFTP